MDLLSIGRTIWRHKLATLPVILLMFVGVVYTFALKKPVYHATSSYILIAPPGPPTADQINRDPALARIHTDNPYVRFGDLGVIVEVLTQSLGTDQERAALLKTGADPRYTVGPSTDLTTTAPIVDVTGVGTTPAQAIRSADVVGNAISAKLGQMQSAQGVDQHYWITALQVTVPDHAQLQVSGRLRTLVAVIAVGVIVLFVLVSTLNALEERRTLKASKAADTESSPPSSNGSNGHSADEASGRAPTTLDGMLDLERSVRRGQLTDGHSTNGVGILEQPPSGPADDRPMFT